MSAIDYTKALSGEYFAEVRYENPAINYSTYYKLKVLLEDNKLTTIYFPNGGQLDEDHFDSPEMKDRGVFEFADDRDREYEVTLVCLFDEYCAITQDSYQIDKEYKSLSLRRRR